MSSPPVGFSDIRRAEAKFCLKLAVEFVQHRDDGTAFVPLRAISELTECMEAKGFSDREVQVYVDALVSDK